MWYVCGRADSAVVLGMFRGSQCGSEVQVYMCKESVVVHSSLEVSGSGVVLGSTVAECGVMGL